MEKQDLVLAMQEVLNSQHKDDIVLSKPFFNSLMQTIGSKIMDESASKTLASKEGIDKFHYLDSVLSVKNIFRNEDDDKQKEEESKAKENELEEAKKENSLLTEKLNSVTAELEALKAKLNSEEAKEEDKKENSDDEDKKENSDNKEDDSEKKNSVTINTKVAVTNSAENEFAKFASVVNSHPIFS